MTTTSKKKEVKAWAVVTGKGKLRFEEYHMGVKFFPRIATRKSALDFSNPDDQSVPCTITYSLPTSPYKRQGK